jgi:hypothetical protein
MIQATNFIFRNMPKLAAGATVAVQGSSELALGNVLGISSDDIVQSLKESFTALKAYINLFRGYVQCFEQS